MAPKADADREAVATSGRVGQAVTRLRFIVLFALVWVVFAVTVPDFIMGVLNHSVRGIHVAGDLSAVLVMGTALLYLLFQIKQERRVTRLLTVGLGLFAFSQIVRAARLMQLLDGLHGIGPYDWYHFSHVFDDACNGLGLVAITAAFLTAIVDLFETKHKLVVQQEALSQEISRRTQTEEEILREKQKYKDLVKDLPVAVYRNTPGPDGRFLEVNPAHVAMFDGDSEEDLLKVGVSDLYRRASEREEVTERLLRDGFIRNKELELVTLKGRPIWGSVTAVLKHDSQGQPYFDGVIEDITSRVQAEKLLSEQRAKMTESARLASLGIMAGGVAHEINNPLAVIAGCAEQLEARSGDGQADGEFTRRLLQMIRRNVQRIQKTIQGLRSLSRDASGDPFTEASVAAIIGDAAEPCHERFRIHDIDFDTGMPDPSVTIECRPSQISQVVLNLLNNSFDAVKDLPDRWIRLSVAELGEQVEIAVEDSGPGIPKELLEHLFVPFFTTKSDDHGLGLGLSISQAIVEAHQGEIGTDSSNRHTRFFVRLPKCRHRTQKTAQGG